MRKLFVRVQWAAVLAIVVAVLYLSLRPYPEPDREPARWTSWGGFHALSYTGVIGDGEGEHVTPERLAEHLNALRDAGYQAITPEDAAAFLERRVPLPEKALLLLFEGGRKDNFLRATPKLRDVGFVAALCVPTAVTRRWGSFYLKEKELRKVAELPHWRLCSMGHDSYEPVTVDADKNSGHFLTRFEWRDGRRETDGEFRARISRDVETARTIFENVKAGTVSVFVYPFADWGASPESRSVEARINREVVGRYHDIAFSRSGDSFNGLNADPLALSRLRVEGDWNAGRLLSELETFSPRTTPVNMNREENIWRAGPGISRQSGGLLIGQAATAWVRGSGDWRDVDARAVVALKDRESLAALYLRHTGPDSYLRASLNGNGIRLQERTAGRTRNLGARELDPSTADGARELRLRVKGRRAWLWLDEEPVAGPVPVAAVTHHGRVGVGAQGGEVVLSEFHARPLQARFVFAPAFSSLAPEQRDAAAAILPPWFANGAAGALDGRHRRELLNAAAAGVETIPVLRVTAELSAADAADLARALAEALQGPVFGRLVSRIAVSEPGTAVSSALAAQGYAVVHLVDEESALARVESGSLSADDVILVQGTAAGIQAITDRLLHVMPPSRIVARVDESAALPAWMRVAVQFDGRPQ